MQKTKIQKKLSILILVGIFFIFSYSSYAFEEGDIAGAWLFDEGSGKTATDSSGNGNDGALNGDVDWTDGKVGGALLFDVSGYVEVPFDDSMKVINEGDFTLSAWFRPDELPDRIETVFQQGDENGTGRTWLFVHETANEIRSFLGGATTGSGFSAEIGQWHHGAVVVTEGNGNDSVQLYVNGKREGDPNVLAMESCEGNYFIGSHKSLANTDFFFGALDEVVLIKKALAEDEIQSLMEEGAMGVLPVTAKGKLAVSWGALKKSR